MKSRDIDNTGFRDDDMYFRSPQCWRPARGAMNVLLIRRVRELSIRLHPEFVDVIYKVYIDPTAVLPEELSINSHTFVWKAVVIGLYPGGGVDSDGALCTSPPRTKLDCRVNAEMLAEDRDGRWTKWAWLFEVSICPSALKARLRRTSRRTSSSSIADIECMPRDLKPLKFLGVARLSSKLQERAGVPR